MPILHIDESQEQYMAVGHVEKPSAVVPFLSKALFLLRTAFTTLVMFDLMNTLLSQSAESSDASKQCLRDPLVVCFAFKGLHMYTHIRRAKLFKPRTG